MRGAIFLQDVAAVQNKLKQFFFFNVIVTLVDEVPVVCMF